MAITILQTPATVSLSQSPMVFSISSSTAVANSGFEYVCNLYIWDGSITNSGSYAYQLVKYPNNAKCGIFEFGRIVNSTMTDLAQNNKSNVKFVKGDFFFRYLSGSVYVENTGSLVTSNVFKALDGYGIFQEPIGQDITFKTPYWPLMTDGPNSSSVLLDNRGYSGVFVANASPVASEPTKLVYTSNLGVTGEIQLSGSTSNNTSTQIQTYPIAPSEPGFPLAQIGLESYTIQAFNGATPLSAKLTYSVTCNQKYPNVRIKWKNRYGQFDYLNFNLVSRQSFATEKRTYEPQLGTWDSSTLSYGQADTAVQNYIVDSKLGISVNTNWLPQDWNEILKQLLVSDEIYWIYDEPNSFVRPLTVTTSNVVFKTGVVDQLIQYQLDFTYGQGYKLII
jgi:hypothetical protein